MTSIYLIRHAEYISGQLDGAGPTVDLGLSAVGREQAEALRIRLASWDILKPHALYASTLPRAVQTAEVLVSALGQPVLREAELEEWRSGNGTIAEEEFNAVWHGLSKRERQNHRFVSSYETGVEFAARVQSALEHIVEKHTGQTVVLVVHGGVIEVAFCYFLGLEDGPFRGSYPAVGNTSITHWRHDAKSNEWVLEYSNDLHHLRGAA